MSKFIVWSKYGSEKWSHSDDLGTLDKVLEFITSDQCGKEYIVTEVVEVKLVRANQPLTTPLPTVFATEHSIDVLTPRGFVDYDPTEGEK